MMDILDELANFGSVEKDRPLSEMTTLRIGGPCAYVVYPENGMGLIALMRYLREKEVPWKIFGKGSDILCSDDAYEGVVIRLDRHMNDAFFVGDRVMAQAGCSIIALAVTAMKHGLSGLEFASGIPGTVGGAVYMNAGAYKASMMDIVKRVLVLKDEEISWMDVSECGFSYRTSVFQDHPDWVVLAVEMELTEDDPEKIEALMDDRRQRRLASQPLNYPTCGSVFRNPEGYNAWQLIEGIGYRGLRKGGAMVSDKHCNFIVNENHATAADYIALVEEIQEKVEAQYGVRLHTEMEKFNWNSKK